jgi:hypothetical protein
MFPLRCAGGLCGDEDGNVGRTANAAPEMLVRSKLRRDSFDMVEGVYRRIGRACRASAVDAALLSQRTPQTYTRTMSKDQIGKGHAPRL